jgi:hypothetical protein
MEFAFLSRRSNLHQYRLSFILFIVTASLCDSSSPDEKCLQSIYPLDGYSISSDEAESLTAQLQINCYGFATAWMLEWDPGGKSSVSISLNDTVDEHFEIHTRVRYRGVQHWTWTVSRVDGSVESLNQTFHFFPLFSPKLSISFPTKNGFIYKRGVPLFFVSEVEEESGIIKSHGYPFYFLDIAVEGPQPDSSQSADMINSQRRFHQRHPPYLTPMSSTSMVFLNGVREEDNPIPGQYLLSVALLDGSGHATGVIEHREIHIDFTLEYAPVESRRDVTACLDPSPTASDEASSSCQASDTHVSAPDAAKLAPAGRSSCARLPTDCQVSPDPPPPKLSSPCRIPSSPLSSPHLPYSLHPVPHPLTPSTPACIALLQPAYAMQPQLPTPCPPTPCSPSCLRHARLRHARLRHAAPAGSAMPASTALGTAWGAG